MDPGGLVGPMGAFIHELGPHFVLVAQGSQHLRLLEDFSKPFLRRNYTKPQFYPVVDVDTVEFHEGWYRCFRGE